MSPSPRTHYLCCIPVEGAVTALGYFQASVCVVGILLVLQAAVMSFVDYISFNQYNYGHNLITYIQIMCMWLLVLAVCLTLAIYLIVGVHKRRPGYVLSYLILGLLKVIALTGYWVVRVHDDYYFIYEGAIEIFLLLFVYSLFLVMVYFVYRNIKLEKEPNNMIYNILQENCTNDIKTKGVV